MTGGLGRRGLGRTAIVLACVLITSSVLAALTLAGPFSGNPTPAVVYEERAEEVWDPSQK